MLRRSTLSTLLVAVVLASACGAAAETAAEPASTAPTGAPTTSAAAPAGGPLEPATPDATTETEARSTPDARSEAATGVSCGAVENPPLQAGSHLLGDQEPPVAYSSQPPTSGWHSSGHVDVDVRTADDPLTEPEQVSVLEAGGVVVSHGDLPDDDIAALAAHVEDRYPGQVAVTPYDQLDDGEVAFTAWGTLRRCDGVDLDALDRFVAEFGSDAPVTPGHSD